MNKKIISVKEAAKLLKPGQTVMFGGFLSVGGPNVIVDEIVNNKTDNLTIIANDTAFVDKGIGKLIVNKQIKKAIVSHIGTNKETGNQLNSGELEIELSPQGTLAERVRSGGYGLGGILTPTGIGTVVADGKQVIKVDGNEFLLEKPLRADIAFVKGAKADKLGNIICSKSTRNFSPLMAFAADIVVAEVEEIVEVGELDPDHIHIPHVLVTYIVKA